MVDGAWYEVNGVIRPSELQGVSRAELSAVSGAVVAG